VRILGVNGILTKGEGSTDLLLGALAARGHECIDIDIPVRGVFAARLPWITRADAKRVLREHRPGDVVVAHSRGALLTYQALRAGARFSQVFLFAPAMEADLPWPRNVNQVWVIHNPTDPALWVGRWLRRHPFGDLGRTGYAGPVDPRIRSKAVEYPGHSDYFAPGHVAYWARFVHERITTFQGVLAEPARSPATA